MRFELLEVWVLSDWPDLWYRYEFLWNLTSSYGSKFWKCSWKNVFFQIFQAISNWYYEIERNHSFSIAFDLIFELILEAKYKTLYSKSIRVLDITLVNNDLKFPITLASLEILTYFNTILFHPGSFDSSYVAGSWAFKWCLLSPGHFVHCRIKMK